MENNIEDRKIKGRVYGLFSVITALMYALHIVFKVVYSNMATDIAYADSLLADAVVMAMDVVELIGISSCFGALIFCLYIGGVRYSAGALAITGIATAAKNIIGSRSMISLMTGGGVSLKGLFNVSSFLIEIIQYAALVLIVSAIMNKYRQKKLLSQKLARNMRAASGNVAEGSVYPFKKIFDRTNPVLFSVLWGGILIIIFSMLNTLMKYIISAINFWPLIQEEIAQQPLGILLSFAQHLLTNLSRGVICFFSVLLLETVFFEWYYKEKMFK